MSKGGSRRLASCCMVHLQKMGIRRRRAKASRHDSGSELRPWPRAENYAQSRVARGFLAFEQRSPTGRAMADANEHDITIIGRHATRVNRTRAVESAPLAPSHCPVACLHSRSYGALERLGASAMDARLQPALTTRELRRAAKCVYRPRSSASLKLPCSVRPLNP